VAIVIDEHASHAFWQSYLAQLPAQHAHHARSRPAAFGFGFEPALADELAELVVAGRKRATTSLPIEFTSLGEALPQAGDLGIVVRGDGKPVALIELTDVSSVPFKSVDARYAAIEGEGEATLEEWRLDHTWYFGEVTERLGGHFDVTTPVLCQIFRVLWPAAIRS
jgi:uncharacterized protein YhfF